MSMLNNALSGLNAANIALTVSGQNVANAAVEGYSRQQAQFKTSNVYLGGVEVASVDRVVDAFLNDDIWRTNSDTTYYENKQSYLGFIEQIIGTDSLNLNNSLASLTDALNAAATKPDSQAFRQQFLSSAEGFMQDIAQINGALAGQATKLNAQMSNVALNVSSITKQIAEINSSIGLATANKQSTAELKDNRERLVNQLSGHIGVSIVERDNGFIDISTLSGAPLVVGSKAASISVNGTTVTSNFIGQEFTLDKNVGGQFGGLISVDNDVIKPTLATLNSLVADLADDMNGALQSGFDLNNDPGEALFTYNPLNPLGTIEINPAITTDKLGFKDSSTSGPGDNSNIANIVASMAGKGDKFTLLVGDLAITSKQNLNSITTATNLSENAIAARDSYSGVNLDEEAANLMHFQQMYSANAKVISTADQMFKSLLQMF
ncbi:flagellar hook-associated protein 1 FlgK [Pseudoalteromonas undina]|uniref:Flagellar hook-associated protein 1 n=2 Tax=Pseudoalteromonas TaxID=53246 RepID=A0AA37W2P2_9GAMM|nr:MULTISPECIES: flagellar hook-associated protein FlgK [Pseudoalteromonas]ADT67842.1 lateral flagellar hook-associated protein [Pseudoalteromonas sp. SM9913]ATD02507.1 flagellar hook-associated protein 1 FlgK [Pseudoalteromonas tetraodonis]KAF7767037.1 flagellar hook-associated protein 1 FlgK [Pseudoalteromonas undina]KPZ66344.1 Flagellar hook-associated protein 1 [Pseudoalteromonas sp. P1-16-1b]MDN3394807.1 flagellar hook-associated protein FlgK [Pseudoalteromonas sp. APC 3215]